MNQLQTIIIQTILPKLLLNRHFPHAMIYGNTLYGGLNLPNIRQQQLYLHVKNLIIGIRKRKHWSQLIIILYKIIQLEIGTNIIPLQDDIQIYIKNNNWIMILWKILLEFDFQINIKDKLTFHPQRQNDTNIMKTSKLQKFNIHKQ